MTFSDLQTLVGYWLDDPSFGYFPLATVKTTINNAQREVQKMLLQAGDNWYVTPVTTPTVYGQNEYVIPTDFLKSHRMEIVTSGTAPNEAVYPISPMTLNQQDSVSNGVGTPECYYIKKNRFVLYPAPDTANLTIRLYYSPLVADMVNQSDVPDVPTQYQELIAIVSTLDGLQKDGRDPTAMLEKKRTYEQLMKQDAESRLQDAPRMVRDTYDDGGVMF